MKEKEDNQFQDYEGYAEYEENGFEMDHISLKRSIECPYCGTSNNIDFEDKCETSSEKRKMRSEIVYSFDLEDYECESCGRPFRVYGSIWEYPVGAFNYQNINVESLEDEENRKEH